MWATQERGSKNTRAESAQRRDQSSPVEEGRDGEEEKNRVWSRLAGSGLYKHVVMTQCWNFKRLGKLKSFHCLIIITFLRLPFLCFRIIFFILKYKWDAINIELRMLRKPCSTNGRILLCSCAMALKLRSWMAHFSRNPPFCLGSPLSLPCAPGHKWEIWRNSERSLCGWNKIELRSKV